MTNNHVLITGVHTGLGFALTQQYLADGARVYGVSRRAPSALLQHERFAFAALDLRSQTGIGAVISELLVGVDRLDLVLLNAGVLGEIKDLRDTSLEELRAVMDVNVWANKVIIDVLMGSGCQVPQIVAISSGAAFNGSGGWGAYSISKSALNLLIRVYAHEHPDTHFVALAPGIVDTNMIQYILAQPEEARYAANDRIRQAQAESRVLTPEVAAANIRARVGDLLAHPSGAYVDIRNL